MMPDGKAADFAMIEARLKGISDWLKKNGRGCFDQQKHLDQDSQERIYWHYGYMVALSDVWRYLTGEPLPTATRGIQRPDTHTEYPLA